MKNKNYITVNILMSRGMKKSTAYALLYQMEAHGAKVYHKSGLRMYETEFAKYEDILEKAS